MPIQLLALDLDGTVLNNAKHISPGNRRALDAAIAAGVTVVPASGRPLNGLSEEFLAVPGVNYAITSNGGAVYRLSDGALIHCAYMTDQTAADVMARLLKLNVLATFFADGKGYATASQLSLLERLTVPEPVKDYLRHSRIVLDDPVDYILTHGRVEKFTLNFLHDDNGWVDYDGVKAILADYPRLLAVSGGHDNLEITDAEASKGIALWALADYLGIPRDATMAIGDSENDLAMLRAAGFSVAMANSEHCVFDVADAVTASNENDGVARAIEQYVLTP